MGIGMRGGNLPRRDALRARSPLPARIRAALEAAGCARSLAPEIGGVARALAASQPAGSYLCIGPGAGELAAWILDGMDPSSGVVTLVQDTTEAEVLARELDCDVRASVHRQDAESFLADVHAHRFNLIADALAEPHATAVRSALDLLRPGGFYLACRAFALDAEPLAREHREAESRDPAARGRERVKTQLGIDQLESDGFEVAQLGERGAPLLVVRRVRPSRPRRRSRSR
ncbi:MAG TPA: hypothetical protein VEC18_10110 [Myxococcota bacterium]|nr:hypothetical protein [Myxococcota bacterium]